ncbi:hypothetical protein GQ55_5G334300 [Panicum hallii var. hallii]|uniref:Uncharacterized protein n=1 Tax=Panicum hallii var. hallii TaxID=1504633 RepID=A0A2T7DLX8_9POAL|nr:hypothetical protein GQ55_5G334300 [Panicum hallii var. hallii]
MSEFITYLRYLDPPLQQPAGQVRWPAHPHRHFPTAEKLGIRVTPD